MARFGPLALHKPGGKPRCSSFSLLQPPLLAFIAWRCWEEISEARELFKISYHLTPERKVVTFHVSSLAKKAPRPLCRLHGASLMPGNAAVATQICYGRQPQHRNGKPGLSSLPGMGAWAEPTESQKTIQFSE